MSNEKDKKPTFQTKFEGILGGFTDLLEKLGELAEKGEQFSQNVEFGGKNKDIKGVYGVSVKFGLGGDKPKVEPFGNIRKDETSGQSFVHEVREPMADIFEEKDHILVLVEMPGISEKDITLKLLDDLLEINAQSGEKKYHKEILLPKACPEEKMVFSCNNGILEIKCPS